MTSKLISKEVIAKPIEYPCLMKNSRNKGLIVLMTRKGTGTVMTSNDPSYALGKYCSNWTPEGFTPLGDTEVIILSNGPGSIEALKTLED